MSMTRIAHLSGLHLLEDDFDARRGRERRRLAYVSLLRPKDPAWRRGRALAALSAARDSGADHVVVTGDVTEDGVDAQFEVLAEVLAESACPPSRVTLVPGNHDAYAHGDAWSRALEGPLRAYRATSTSGSAVVLGDAVLLPLSTARTQPYARSAGWLDPEQLEQARAVAAGSSHRGRALVLVMHHAPVERSFAPVQWARGLEQHAAIRAILERYDHVSVLHGHAPADRDRALRPGGSPRIHGAEAVVDGRSPLRLYDAQWGRLSPVPQAPQAFAELALA